MAETNLVEQVEAKYASVAQSGLSSNHDGVRAVAQAFGYTPEELAGLPADSNMGLSCGNPTATANLKPGEVVVDLGCGGAIDVLLASRKVGPTGNAIGIDMTAEMIERAKRNAVAFGNGQSPANVKFHLSRIEALPLPDNSVDCLISNCVINLAPDKSVVFREMFRVLEPGGRVAVSDIALKQPLPPEVGQDILAYVGCIGGALLIKDYEQMLAQAGFKAVKIIDTKKDLNAYAQASDAGCCGSMSCCSAGAPLHENLAELLTRYNVNHYAASVQVFAIKPLEQAAMGQGKS
ncbi:MAG TPA: methyltransferase domain-containing protein [Gemmataceae bacterium]|nr:methyltransferase domain-containing protein [Gemmataceae bacterium]